MEDKHTLISFIAEYWQVVFIFVFKYLQDIKGSLELLHTDNAVKENRISNLEEDIKELKGWIKRVEDKIP